MGSFCSSPEWVQGSLGGRVGPHLNLLKDLVASCHPMKPRQPTLPNYRNSALCFHPVLCIFGGLFPHLGRWQQGILGVECSQPVPSLLFSSPSSCHFSLGQWKLLSVSLQKLQSPYFPSWSMQITEVVALELLWKLNEKMHLTSWHLGTEYVTNCVIAVLGTLLATGPCHFSSSYPRTCCFRRLEPSTGAHLFFMFLSEKSKVNLAFLFL